MTLLLISELAERSGVPVSTLRYYERIGLVEPSCRADNNYREYDEATLDRLAFIARAKRLGMRLDDVATLMEAWFAGECEPLRNRLRSFVTGRLGELRRHMAEDQAFESQLKRILSRLSDPGPATRRCVPDCGCDTDLLDGADINVTEIRCSLAADDAERRIGEWRRLMAAARRSERTDDTFRAEFDPSAGLIIEAARLCEAEIGCCPFLTFKVEITVTGIVITIGGPTDALDLIDAAIDHLDTFGAPFSPAMAVADDPVPSSVPTGAAGHIPVSAPAARRSGRQQPSANRVSSK